MGYVNDTHSSQFIPPFKIAKTAGTWTPTIASNLISDVRTAADVDFTLLVPIRLFSNEVALKGSYLKSVDLWFKIFAAACNSCDPVALNKVTVPILQVTGAAVGADVPVTLTTGNETNAKRLTVDTHHLIATLVTPVWVDYRDKYVLSMVVDPGATTVFTLYGARVNYTLRL